MSARLSLGFVLLAASACDDGTEISEFSYGASQPGSTLPEGGEIRHENIRILGMAEQTWVMVYQYTAPDSVPTAPFAAPAQGGKGIYGNCVDERAGSPTWPFTPITGATYLDLPRVALSGPGIMTALNIIKSSPVNTVGNSTYRKYGFTYGGGGAGDPMGFNASMTTAQMSKPGGDYTIDIGKGAPMQYHMPESYTAPLGIGGNAKVVIPAAQDLELSWTAPANDLGPSGTEHTKQTYFNFTLFADLTARNPPQFICFPDVDGHQIIPKAVIDALPAEGLIIHANLSHYMEAREAAPGELRRFDLVSTFGNISQYGKQ